MSEPTPIDLEALQRLAQEATKGEWTNGVPDGRNDRHMCRVNAWPDGRGWPHTGEQVAATWHPETVVSYVGLSRQQCVDNANYIAAVNPAVLLALIAALGQVREEIAQRLRQCEAREKDKGWPLAPRYEEGACQLRQVLARLDAAVRLPPKET